MTETPATIHAELTPKAKKTKLIEAFLGNNNIDEIKNLLSQDAKITDETVQNNKLFQGKLRNCIAGSKVDELQLFLRAGIRYIDGIPILISIYEKLEKSQNDRRIRCSSAKIGNEMPQKLLQEVASDILKPMECVILNINISAEVKKYISLKLFEAKQSFFFSDSKLEGPLRAQCLIEILSNIENESDSRLKAISKALILVLFFSNSKVKKLAQFMAKPFFIDAPTMTGSLNSQKVHTELNTYREYQSYINKIVTILYYYLECNAFQAHNIKKIAKEFAELVNKIYHEKECVSKDGLTINLSTRKYTESLMHQFNFLVKSKCDVIKSTENNTNYNPT